MDKINLKRRALLTYFPPAFSGLILLSSGLTSLSIAIPTSSKKTFEALSMWLCGFDSLDEKLLSAYRINLIKSAGEDKVKQCLRAFDEFIHLENHNPQNQNNFRPFIQQHQQFCQTLLTLWYTGRLQDEQHPPTLRAYAYVNALQWKVAEVTAKSTPDLDWHLPI